MSTFQSGGSATCVVELDEMQKPHEQIRIKEPTENINHRLSRVESNRSKIIHTENDVDGSLPSPTTATEELQRWNYPKKNMFRTFAAFWGFIIMGANDAAVGVCLMPENTNSRRMLTVTGSPTICTYALH
jgi:hypothetical protein